MFDIREDDLTHPATRALLALHVGGMQAYSPSCSVHALDPSGLQAPGVTVWTAWKADALAGIAALRQPGDATGEIKSMRTHPDFLRMGCAAFLLDHIIAQAHARRLRRLSLETGSGRAFAPALALYRKYGFANGEAFGGYTETAFNQFLHRDL